MKYLALFLLFISLLSPVYAGDPGENFWKLDGYRKADAKLDNKIKNSIRRLNAGQLNISQAHDEWVGFAAEAKARLGELQALQDSMDMDTLSHLISLARNQCGRINLLVQGAALERDKGMPAAKQTYDWQKEKYEQYLSVKKLAERHCQDRIDNP